MPTLFIGIIIAVIGIILFIYSTYSLRNTHKINQNIDKKNEQLKIQNNNYCKERDKILNDIFQQTIILNNKKEEINQYQNQLNDIQNNISKTLDNQKELSQKAFENYCETLENKYKEAEDEYAQYTDAMQTAYSTLQIKLMQDADAVREELAQIEATRAAAIQAQLKEKEIKDNKDNFRLNISEASKKDIRLLKSIQPDITNSIVIDKIIWSNYYQPLAKTKFPQIIGKATACGIYKITSLTTGAPYIGQSSDCCDRWKQHCKNALGVGNVVNENKLYKAMKEEGLYNFTFEMLEECDRSVLDEKEKYYIKLYKAYDFGLNGNRGNN